MNDQAQSEIKRITEKYDVEAQHRRLREQQKQKQEKLLKPVEVIRETFNQEYEDDEQQQEDPHSRVEDRHMMEDD